ncbi:hypothetical protein M0R45_020357 [Rubus argutus]|uniref:R13L1/DRL21-like LRR repeat region domain-containing protein n=1 Tax=Rubus argutus TaxID=59490 RepID=A0AAW1XBM6_RUBAR
MKSLRKVAIIDCGGLSILPSGLQFCTALRELQLWNCPLVTSISVGGLSSLQNLSVFACPLLTSIDGLGDCTSLESLNLSDCPLLGSIPIIQGMPFLRSLKIRGCGGLSILPSGLNCCTSLQELSVSDCPLVTSIPIIQGMPSLRQLEIACAGLSSLPSGLRFCTSLEELSIQGGCFRELPLPSISCTRVLRRLTIRGCCELTSISMSSHPESEEESFPSLLVLRIEDCTSLESIIPADLQGFTCLRELTIQKCGKLKYLPTGLHCLTRLEAVNVGGLWEELDSFPDLQLPPKLFLYKLALYGWPKLKCLPQIHHLTCLTRLEIYNFGGLESLPDWLGNFEYLEALNLIKCENLKYLPTLEAMQRLTNLKTLYIWRCPLLEERCISNGPEWPKISHIGVQTRPSWFVEEDSS